MATEHNFFSYLRISTQEERKKQRFNRQEKALEKYSKEHNIEYLLTFKEDVSGKNFSDRKQWNNLERLLRPGDTIVFKDISRFTREASNGYDKYMELLNKNINLVFIDNATISTEYIRQLLKIAEEQDLVARTSLESTVKLLLIVELDRVEKERLILIKRTMDGLNASGKKSGRAKGHLDKLTPELEHDIELYLQDRSITQNSLIKKHNISRNTLKKYALIKKTQLGS